MLLEPRAGARMPHQGPLVDRFGRAHSYLRLSVTDRCNYRCTYCMPAEGLDWMPRSGVLSYEESGRLVGIMSGMGIRRVRLTGGEPLLRRDLEKLLELCRRDAQLDEISMTTNAQLLAPRARALAAAGLDRVNISLDCLDAEQHRAITRGGELDQVLAGIDAAIEAGLTPVKINAVIVAGENEDQVLPLARFAAGLGDRVQLRFLEHMPFDMATQRSHRASEEMRAALAPLGTLEPLGHDPAGGPAERWRVRETGQVIGFISPITSHFCDACNRLRLLADGHLRTCLSKDDQPSLRDLMRSGASDDLLERAIRRQVWGKVAGHRAHLDDWQQFEGAMTQIGG